MDASASLSIEEVVRPWRTATLVASLLAAVELVLLLVCGAILLAHPLARAVQQHAAKVASAPAKPATHAKTQPAAHQAVTPPPVALRPRAKIGVLVLNGNGRSGVAHVEASRLQSLGYKVSGAANAARDDYATTLVMYENGYRAEGLRLARDLHVHAVGPLDGMKPAALDGGQLAVILGAA